MSFKSVYARHFGRYASDHASLDEAVGFLRSGADDCQLFPICIVGPDGKVYFEKSPTFNISKDVEPILKRLKIPYTSERGTFAFD